MSTAIYFPQPIEVDDEARTDSSEPPNRQRWTVAKRALASALLLAIVATVTIAIANANAQPARSDLPIVVAGTAELTTRRYLGESDERYIVGTAVIDGRRSDDAWAVVVAAELLARTDAGFVVDGVHYYRVRISEQNGTWKAAGAPAEVAGPAIAPIEPVMLEPPDADSAAVSAIQGYLGWYLTGLEGPYNTARPTPAPYVSATITGLRIVPGPRETSIASVQVVGLDRFGHTLDLAYELTLVLHRGSWIVATDDSS